jgi:hypothetical protein
MFKKKCSKCNNKIQKSYDFCPSCGNNLKSKNDNKDFGFLGKNDIVEDNQQMGLGGSFMNKMINKAMKELPNIMRSMEEQMNNEMQNSNQNPHDNQPSLPNSNMKIKFMVNGKEVPLNNSPKKVQPQKIQTKKISEEKIQQISKLPRKEPKTKMKRLSGKLIYELSVPGVKDIQDILINQLENSIEIKAISKDKVYSKTINANLPILRYTLIKGILIIEFQQK